MCYVFDAKSQSSYAALSYLHNVVGVAHNLISSQSIYLTHDHQPKVSCI